MTEHPIRLCRSQVRPFDGEQYAMQTGVQAIMKRAESKAGEKTILDALIPAVDELKRYSNSNEERAYHAAAEAAAAGAEETANILW